MQPRLDLVAEPVDQDRGAACHARRMGHPRVRRLAELVEVAAGAETSSLAVEHDLGDRRILDRHAERFAERIAQAAGVRVALVRTIERDPQHVVGPRHPHGRGIGFRARRTLLSRCKPGLELRSMLQGRVGERLGEEPVPDADALVVAQQANQHHGGVRVAADRLGDERTGIRILHHDVDHVRHIDAVRHRHDRTVRDGVDRGPGAGLEVHEHA